MKIKNEFNNFVKNPQMYKFIIVGVCSAVFLLTGTIFLTSVMNIHYAISVAISYEIAIIWSFFVHDKWTFSNAQKNNSKKERFIKFNLISLCGMGVNEGVLIFFTTMFGLHYTIGEIFAIFIAFFFNFLFQKKFSWKT